MIRPWPVTVAGRGPKHRRHADPVDATLMWGWTMRARNLKPGFFTNEQLANCQPLARILYQGLWCLADRAGKMEYRPLKIKAAILPFDSCDTEKLIGELESQKLVKRYEVEGQQFLIIPKFTRHQTPHFKEKESEIPDPQEVIKKPSASPGQAQVLPPLNPDSGFRIPDSGIPLPEAGEANGKKVEIGYQKTAEGCALAWMDRLKRPAKAEDATHGSLPTFQEFVRLGTKPETLLAAILDEKRDRTEHLWEFKKRVVAKAREPTLSRLAEKQKEIRERREREQREGRT